ncbi:hypothetical protein [Profundibacterium mesophilum]|uniref:hypothetical protein n=1 Tax=Profundibacterium mesophilum TaxID=1258573 RepID=UPI00135B1DC9|nr:hypothetical protein [Profundibacterium mesophilum]
MNQNGLIILNQYELLSTANSFELATKALAARVHEEGHAGVLSYRFFVNPDMLIARAVVEYVDPDAWIGHHNTSMNWPEMKDLHAVAHLGEVTFLGEMTPDIATWISNSSLKAKVLSGNRYVAGFQRTTDLS